MPSTHVCARPECENRCPIKVKYCSPECMIIMRQRAAETARALRTANPSAPAPPKAEQERRRLEDRFLEQAAAYLKAHPSKVHRLAPVSRKLTKASPHEMLLMLSDAHYPEVVDPDVAMGLKYDADICVRRLERVRNVVVRYKQLRETSYPIRKLTVAVLGDMLSGDIHEELEVSNQFPLSEALVKMAYYLHDLFLSLAKEFPVVEVVVIPGNHPRQFKKPRYKAKTITNFEYILGHFIASLAGGSYRVQVPKDLVYRHKVFDFTVAMTHGDGVQSNSFAGIPFYGLKQRTDALQSLMRHLKEDGIDYLLMGHFHRVTEIDGTDSTLIINGALKGGDEYSLGSRYSANDPVQLLLTFHQAHGLTDTSRINLKRVI